MQMRRNKSSSIKYQDVHLTKSKIVGDELLIGGKDPDPPLDDWPLLAWMRNHEKHGDDIFTEDGLVSVKTITTDLMTLRSLHEVAIKHGTTPDHVRQAVEYAIASGFLGYD